MLAQSWPRPLWGSYRVRTRAWNIRLSPRARQSRDQRQHAEQSQRAADMRRGRKLKLVDGVRYGLRERGRVAFQCNSGARRALAKTRLWSQPMSAAHPGCSTKARSSTPQESVWPGSLYGGHLMCSLLQRQSERSARGPMLGGRRCDGGFFASGKPVVEYLARCRELRRERNATFANKSWQSSCITCLLLRQLTQQAVNHDNRGL